MSNLFNCTVISTQSYGVCIPSTNTLAMKKKIKTVKKKKIANCSVVLLVGCR